MEIQFTPSFISEALECSDLIVFVQAMVYRALAFKGSDGRYSYRNIYHSFNVELS